MWVTMNKTLAILPLLLALNASADLKDKYKQQQESGNSASIISEGMRLMQNDVNTTWRAIRKNGDFYIIMPGELGKVRRYGGVTARDSRNFSIYDGSRLVYKKNMRDMLVVVAVGDNVFMPLLGSGNFGRREGIWKGRRFQCTKGIRYATPAPLAKIGEDGFAAFQAHYESTLKIPKKNRKRLDFEVNFQTKECYSAKSSNSQQSVRKCHVVSFKDFTTDTLNRTTNINATDWTKRIFRGLYLRDKNLEYCALGE